MSVSEIAFVTWVSSNILLAALLIWHRVIQPRKSRQEILNRQSSARTIDDLQGVVWG